ncbi:MAG: hypothetical protein VX023_02490 [Candidatus Thermoplasmatota archaeon]|nr:hypothetical protein [Candidatus Thermoplasmatota archaeon]
MATRRNYVPATAITMLIMMILMSTTSGVTTPQLPISEPMDTEGRQGSSGLSDVDCSGYTFEDLFDYNFALFNINIGTDWATAEMEATAYVNGSNSATVRENLDGLFEGAPGGDNDWISTDEREAVREIGPMCIEDMDTRLGIREGVPHRTNSGVAWNDLEFVEEGIALDEVDLVAPNHPEERSCTNFGASADCKEIPVSATDDLQISLFVKSGESNNMRFNQLPNQGVSNFTLALNVTNMTNADLVMTFPALQGLRMAGFAMEDDGVELVAGQDYTAPEEEFLPDGKLRIYQHVDYQKSNWPVGRNLFIDFTTAEPESNDIPQWTNMKPNNNSIIPLMTGTEYLTVSSDRLSNWATDSNGWNLDCEFSDTGWESRQDESGNLLVRSPSGANTASATCSVVDPFGASADETLDFTFGQPFTASAAINDGENIDFTVTPTGLVAEMTVSASAHQDGTMGSMRSTMASSDAVTIALPMDGLKPGMVMVMGTTSANNMMNFDYMLDFGLEKESLPPIISLKTSFDGNNATWDATGLQFTLKGTVSDPDGESVEMTLQLCGASATDFTQVGINWEIDVSIATCVMQEITTYDVIITATDESNIASTLDVNVVDPNVQSIIDDNSNSEDDTSSDANSLLPSISMIATISVALAGAALIRRDEE